MDKKSYFYNKSWFRNTILITIPSLISVIGVIISLVPIKSQTIKNTLLLIIACLMIVLIVLVIFFSNQDDKLYNEAEIIKTENQKLTMILAHLENTCKTQLFTISAFSSFSEKWAKTINSFANNVLSNGKISNKAWNKIKVFDSVCFQCKNMIEQYCNNNDGSKVSVNFVSYSEDEYGEKWVHMISHSNTESTRPNACKKPEKLSECTYHYADLIKDDFSDIDVAINNDEILRIFKRVSKNTDLSKYTQYIAIPVYCTSQKLLGIFQIVTKYNYIIEPEKIELLRFVEENVIPYSNLIVLVDKINKGLYINPKEIQEEQ